MNKNWQIKKLGEVCEMINRGISPKYNDSSGLCVLNQKCIRNHEVNFELARTHDSTIKKVADDKLIQVGDVLINSTGTGTLGRVAQVTRLPCKATVDSHVTIVRPLKDMFYIPFFGYALIYIEDEISKRGEGCGGQTELARNILKNDFTISYPESHKEQQGIVAILDKAFAAIDIAKCNVKMNLEGTKNIFETYLQEIFEKNTNWEEKTLGEIATVEYGYTDNSTAEGDYRYIRITDISDDGELIAENKKYIKYSKEAENYTLEDNDLLMARTGATFAKVLLYRKHEASVFASYLIRIKFTGNIENKLYWYFSKSRCYWNQAKELSSGSAQPHFNGAALKKIIFPYPKSINEQNLAIEKMTAVFRETKKLESIYQKKLALLDELKKSLLEKAFSGEL